MKMFSYFIKGALERKGYTIRRDVALVGIRTKLKRLFLISQPCCSLPRPQGPGRDCTLSKLMPSLWFAILNCFCWRMCYPLGLLTLRRSGLLTGTG